MKANNDNAKKDLERHKKIIGKRLTEVMQLKQMDRTSLRKILEEKENYPISRQTFAKYQNGENWIPSELINIISKLLDIDPGYLQAKDNYFVESYDEYLEWYQLVTNRGLEYYKLIKELGFIWSYDDEEYDISRLDDPLNRKTFTFDELVEFHSRIKEYALKLFDEMEDR
jgi:hypothetical protein